MDKHTTWSQRLEAIIKERDLSKRALSKAIGKSESYIGKMIADGDKPREPSWSTVQALCRELNITPSELMGDGGTSNAA